MRKIIQGSEMQLYDSIDNYIVKLNLLFRRLSSFVVLIIRHGKNVSNSADESFTILSFLIIDIRRREYCENI